MQIVIDIDDDMYKSVANNDAYVLGDADWILLENAIANGTPLPKHHGRLIDADALMKLYELEDATKYGNETAEQQTHSYDTMMMYEIADMLDDAPTIIEADKESE